MFLLLHCGKAMSFTDLKAYSDFLAMHDCAEDDEAESHDSLYA